MTATQPPLGKMQPLPPRTGSAQKRRRRPSLAVRAGRRRRENLRSRDQILTYGLLTGIVPIKKTDPQVRFSMRQGLALAAPPITRRLALRLRGGRPVP